MIIFCINLYAIYISTKVSFLCLEKERIGYFGLNVFCALANVIAVGSKLNKILGL